MAAILDFPLPVKSDSFTDSSIGIAVIENGGSRWNFVFISSGSHDMPGGILIFVSNERLKIGLALQRLIFIFMFHVQCF